jgi:ABC-type transporter Mla subunit MlaD
MADPNELSVTTVVTLVLGGVAAFVLALVIALGGYGQGQAKKPTTTVRAEPAPSASGAEQRDVEIPLDTTEP